MKRMRLRIVGWIIGTIVAILRLTCRVRVHHDPRPALRSAGISHVLSVLHGHQLAGLIASDAGVGVMVSRSDDGEIVIPTVRVCGLVPVRGSSGTAKGGAAALQSMIEHVNAGFPAVLTVDGPRGPRGRVQRGIGLLARKTDATVVTVVAIPSRRWIMSRSWDRLQIPKPFSTIDVYVAKPLAIESGESLEHFALRIERQLADLERKHDPLEAAAARETAVRHPNRAAA